MNKVILSGNLGKDPKKNNGGSVYLRIATSEFAKGERKTSWHDVICFNGQADFAGEYLKSGDRVLVEGRINYSEYEGKIRTQIIAHNIEGQGATKNQGSTKN